MTVQEVTFTLLIRNAARLEQLPVTQDLGVSPLRFTGLEPNHVSAL